MQRDIVCWSTLCINVCLQCKSGGCVGKIKNTSDGRTFTYCLVFKLIKPEPFIVHTAIYTMVLISPSTNIKFKLVSVMRYHTFKGPIAYMTKIWITLWLVSTERNFLKTLRNIGSCKGISFQYNSIVHLYNKPLVIPRVSFPQPKFYFYLIMFFLCHKSFLHTSHVPVVRSMNGVTFCFFNRARFSLCICPFGCSWSVCITAIRKRIIFPSYC